jgi:hypothetical protein
MRVQQFDRQGFEQDLETANTKLLLLDRSVRIPFPQIDSPFVVHILEMISAHGIEMLGEMALYIAKCTFFSFAMVQQGVVQIEVYKLGIQQRTGNECV